VLLAYRAVEGAGVAAVVFDELRIAVGRLLGMGGDVLFPQPLQGDCYHQGIFDPGADDILTQPSSLKAKFNNEFGVRNWVNEIPACGSKMHWRQQS